MSRASYSMSYSMWNSINDFIPDEFGAVDMNGILIFTIQEMRKYVNRKIIVHSGYRPGNKGYHPLKMAADIHIEELHVVDQYLVAERFDAFNGIGVYPLWKRPGIHVDVRPNGKLGFDARWGCFEPGNYIKFSHDFFRRIV